MDNEATDAFIYLDKDSGSLSVFFDGEEKEEAISMEITDENEKTIVENLIKDKNFWTSFLGSISAALGRKYG